MDDYFARVDDALKQQLEVGASKPPLCNHLGERVGEILVECESCQGRVRIKQPVHSCAAFGERGRCLLTYVPADLAAWGERKPESEIYHLCHGCERFEAAPPKS